MNKILLLFLVLILPPAPKAVPIEPADHITLGSRTIYRDGNLALPDSMRIQVFHNGAELHDQWYNSADIEVSAVDNWLIFEDQFQDIDGVGGNGQYLVIARAYDADSSLYTPVILNFQVGVKASINSALDSLDLILDSLSIVLDSLRSHDDWVSSLASTDRIGIDLDNTAGRLDSFEIANDAINNNKLATNAITNNQIHTTAAAEIGVYAWTVSPRTITGGAVDSNRTEGAVDSASLARIVWNTPQANHDTEGTFGDYLDADISAIGTGRGLYSYTLVAFDSSVMQVVPGCTFVIRNIDQSALIATGNADMLGRRSFNLDSAGYIAAAFASGYIFTSPDTVTVGGPGVDTLYCSRFDPGTSDQPGLCRVYGFLYDLAGIPEQNALIQARLPGEASRTGSGIVAPFGIETVSDSLGYFYLDLIPNPQLIPDTTKYEISITLDDGTILRKRITVPDQAEWLLTW